MRPFFPLTLAFLSAPLWAADLAVCTDQTPDTIPLSGQLVQRVDRCAVASRMQVHAHRGAGTRPENTMAAFREAIRQGADTIEMDLQITKDEPGKKGTVVIAHDLDLRANQCLDPQGHKQDPKVKAFAAQMIADHGKIDADLKKTVADNHLAVTVPTALDQRRQGMIDNLKQSGDSDFDGAYLHQQLAAHVETLDLLKGFQNHGDNDALKAAAATAAPIVEHHLAMVRDIGGAKLKDAATPG